MVGPITEKKEKKKEIESDPESKKKKRADVLKKKKDEREKLAINIEEQKKAREYLKEAPDNKKAREMVKKVETLSVYKLQRAGSKRLAYEMASEKKKKKMKIEDWQGYAQMTSMFSEVKKTKEGIYLEVDLRGKGRTTERHDWKYGIGAGHLCPPSWKKVKIEDTDGNVRVGVRKIPGDKGVYGEKVGYYEKIGNSWDYIPVFTGYKIYPLEINNNWKKQATSEERFYIEKKKEPLKYSYTKRPATTLDVKAENYDGIEKGRHFERKLTLTETKEGTKYYHIQTRALENPQNGQREMPGKWNDKIAIEWAKDLEKRFGVPWILILATSILESGKGANRLSYDLNNYFGIKPWWKLKKRMFDLARKKYPNYRQLGDFRNGGLQEHMHYSDAWSSFYRYAQLVSETGRYGHSMKFRNNPMMAMACIALSGYCPSESYIRSVGRVLRRLGRKYGVNVGYIDYNELVRHMRRHRKSVSENYIASRLQLPAKSGFVRNMPAYS